MSSVKTPFLLLGLLLMCIFLLMHTVFLDRDGKWSNASTEGNEWSMWSQALGTRSSSQWTEEDVSPLSFDFSHRFDIVVSTVYAMFIQMYGNSSLPRYVNQMHQRHVEIMYNAEDACVDTSNGGSRTISPCNKINFLRDYEHRVRTIMTSLSRGKLNTKHGSVRVNCNGVPIGGDAIIASAIALGMECLPVKRSSCRDVKEHLHLQGSYLDTLGEGFSDFAMLQWTLHVPNTTVVLFWPEATGDYDKMQAARGIVGNKCGNILYERTIRLTKTGLASLVTHAYGLERFLEPKIKLLQTTYPSDPFAVRPITAMFIIPTSPEDVLSCKTKLRKHFSLSEPKSSVHSTDFHREAILLAEMILNPNSRFYLLNHDGSNCRLVAEEIALRKDLRAVNPGQYLVPQDMMVDSGGVMSFFGLRGRTDIDILFQGEVDYDMLGDRRGVHMEAHAFLENNVRGGRAWGVEHITANTSIADLFTDPDNLGYCHGVKFVSLQQLVRYKQRRGEPNKDDRDVAQILEFLKVSGS